MIICPLLMINRERFVLISAKDETENHKIECLEEKCAWYDGYMDECAVLSLAQLLLRVDQQLIKQNKQDEHVGGPR
jgi:hypothetical protein